jgi:DnaJ homolog subfamily B member 4
MNAEREGRESIKQDDIRTFLEINLKGALMGWSRVVTSIDGKSLRISKPGPTKPGYVERYSGLEMPKSKKSSERGDFLVEIRVTFPNSLTDAQRTFFLEGL